TRLNEQRTNGIPLNERQILRIFADICNAVSACHYRRPQPILHRDIKLENILIDSHQSFVLCDFGSAVMLPPSTTNNHQQYQSNQLTTTIIQQLEEEIQRYTTLSYRAPEMIDLYSRLPITLKVDIWAMGCLLYKLMFNTMPFGDSILAIQNGTFVIPDDMSQVYSRDLNKLVRFMLEIDINKRPDIWQVSYITYKLLGIECPIPNRYQSKIPDFNIVPMPLTESESRHQRLMASASAKSTAINTSDETSTLGTAVNPRERPRGIIAPSGSLINFNQTAQRPTTVVVPPPPPPPPAPVPLSASPLVSTPVRPSHQRSGSAAQLMFDDDFSQFPSHTLSLTNIPNMTTTPKTTSTLERNVSRARPSPPASLSSSSGLTFQQQLFPPPPPTSSSSNTQLTSSSTMHHQHRRSASQTISPTNNPSSFLHASSVESNLSFDRRHSIDSSVKQQPQQQPVLFIGEASDDDDDALATNLNKLKVHNHSTENVKSRESLILNEDDRLFAKTYTINSQLKSDDEQSSSSLSHDDENNEKLNKKNKKKSQIAITPLRSGHHPSTEEVEKSISSPSTTNKNLVKRLIGRCSLQQQDEPTASSTPYKRKDSITLANEHPISMNDESDNESDSDNDDDNEKDNDKNNANNNVGFDQLINEDSDDDGPIQTINTNKNNVGSSRFMTTRHKEQQYEHFQDSDDDDNETNNSMTKTSSHSHTKLFNLFTTNSKTNPSNDSKRTMNEHNNQTNSSFIDNDNPFLHAPFHYSHRSPTHKPVTQSSSLSTHVDTMTTSNITSFDPTSIVVGKRLSAFAPYHRQEPNSITNVTDSTSSTYNFNLSKQKIPHSESYPPGNTTITTITTTTTTTNPNNQLAISKDVFTNAPFKAKITTKQQNPMTTNKNNTISPSSSQSTSSSNSQLIDFTVPSQTIVDSTSKEQSQLSPTRRLVGSAGLATNFSTFKTTNTTNNQYYFQSEHINNDGHSSSEELTTSSTRKRHRKKKSSQNTGHDSQQHAYANLSFNDAIKLIINHFIHPTPKTNLNDLEEAILFDNNLLTKCQHFTQGKQSFVVDSKGYLCERRHLEKTNGCCQIKSSSIRGPYICDSCSSTTHCCSSFEHCISCCLNPDHILNDLEPILANRAREQFNNLHRRQILIELLGLQFQWKFFQLEPDIPCILTPPYMLEEHRRKLENEAKSWLQIQAFKAAIEIGATVTEDQDANRLSNDMKNFLEYTYEIVCKSFERYLYQIQQKEEIMKQEEEKLQEINKIKYQNEFIGHSKFRSILRDSQTNSKKSPIINELTSTRHPMTSQYSDIISKSIIALLKCDLRRVIFVKEKLFGQQLPITIRQFIWTECLLRFEKEPLDNDLSFVEFQTRRDFAAGVTRGKNELNLKNPSNTPVTNLIENAVIE
ncbi:unnamed protein product, partial [Rotaria sp. Silwood2]